jgi:LCP family protein required for cell wall assembly
LTSDTTDTTQSPAPDAKPRSGAIAAVLSAIFPGLGQAYLGDRRNAIIFAAPVIALFAFVGFVVLNRNVAFRVLDPSVSLALIVIIVAYGIWWIAAILNAWRGGGHVGTASAVLVVFLALLVGTGDAFAAWSMWRVRNASETIFTANPLDETPPPPTPSPTPMPAGETADPLATPTQRPPDYVDPNDPDNNPTDEPPETIDPGPTPQVDITTIDAQNDGLLNVMLVGLDWQPGRNSKRTDTILIVSANPDTGDVMMFSFPRDSARFPLYNGGTYNGKINTFAGFANNSPDYPDGGLKSLAYEVGYLLGSPVDYYASVNMPGFLSVIDQVGGVTVTNTRNIHDDTLQFYLEPGTYRLSPADALRYVRTRHGSGGDFGRAERQQQVLAALRKEILKPENIARLPDIVEALSTVINTDFPPDQIDRLVQLADQVSSDVTQSWVFGSAGGWSVHLRRIFTCGRSVQFLNIPKIAELSIELFGEKSLWNGVTPPPVPGPRTDCPNPQPTPQ